MYVEKPAATWPGKPEIPQPNPGTPRPGPFPGLPQPDAPQPGTVPQPILPAWFEPMSISVEQEIADRLLAERVLIIGGHLDDRLANHVTAQLLLLDARSNDPITLQLSATESDLEAALSVVGAIGLISAPVHAVARGTVRGPAIAVLAAAGQREAQRHTMFVLSVPHFAAEGTADELATLAEQHTRQTARLRDLIADATGRSPDEVAHDLEGRVLSAEEAQTYGLISRLL
ncbi:ATP-dependent Clp protease proteolytic subunit [Kribbella sp. NPDC054772]